MISNAKRPVIIGGNGIANSGNLGLFREFAKKLGIPVVASAIAADVLYDDYDLYYNLLKGQVGDRFFYYCEQAKFRMNDFPGALADIQSAIRLNPGDPTYPAEEASVYIRMENYDQALRSLENALRIAPDFASCYRLRGICYVRQGKKAEACEAFNKAKELGDPVVDKLIKEHCK